MAPEITVITVCRNAASLLETTIQSVLQQTGVRLEYVIVDGASIDDTSQVLRRYAARVPTIVSEPDTGIYDAMNKGLSRAHGELICFLNAGDTFEAKTVCQQVCARYQEGYPDILYGDVLITSASGKVERRASYDGWDLASFFEFPVCHQGVFATRKAFEVVGPFNQSYRYAADHDWLLRALRRHRLTSCYLPFIISHFDNGGVSTDNQTAVRAELRRAVASNFSLWERLSYRAFRRLRVRKAPFMWRAIINLMRWRLRMPALARSRKFAAEPRA